MRLVFAMLLALAPAPAAADTMVRIRAEAWSAADERGYGEFVTAIGDSGCRSVNGCLNGAANPFRASNPEGFEFRSDCADLPYYLRFYYAWKRGLPFSYVRDVSPRGRSRDVRYSPKGNQVEARRDVLSGDNALSVLGALRDEISSATYRIHPDADDTDLYSPAIQPRAIRPGSVIYDPNGHLAIIYRIEADGRIRYIDAHPDNSLTRGYYDLRFVRASPGMGAGFKNWRPARLAGAARAPDGTLVGGHVVVARNAEIADFALTQFFGTGARPADADWKQGGFVLNGQPMDYYDYVRARLGGGSLRFDPLREVADMVVSNCADLGYRADAVTLALEAGLQNRPQPERLPVNIYGTEGDWETYSTPSRDARLKTAFKELRDTAQRFLTLWRARDPRLVYIGSDLAGDMLAVYDHAASACSLSYVRSDGSRIGFGYEEARRRLMRLSFDPYQCVERRWGAVGGELAACRDGALKRRWYDAEQRLRNQIDRTYEARMDFGLGELEAGQGGVAAPPDTDTRAYLVSEQQKGR
ncbi:MAG TPA: hypothetical protein VGC16_04670 [Rhizomicrobium sp.]